MSKWLLIKDFPHQFGVLGINMEKVNFIWPRVTSDGDMYIVFELDHDKIQIDLNTLYDHSILSEEMSKKDYATLVVTMLLEDSVYYEQQIIRYSSTEETQIEFTGVKKEDL